MPLSCGFADGLKIAIIKDRCAHRNYDQLMDWCATPATPEGITPLGANGQPLNLDFETGTLKDWTATGKAFEEQPIKGDTVAKRPENPRAHNNLANVLLSQGKRRDAMSHYSEAVRLSPTYALAHNNLGNVLAAEGKLGDSIAHYSEALRLNPNFVAAQNASHHRGRELAGRQTGRFPNLLGGRERQLHERIADVDQQIIGR